MRPTTAQKGEGSKPPKGQAGGFGNEGARVEEEGAVATVFGHAIVVNAIADDQATVREPIRVRERPLRRFGRVVRREPGGEIDHRAVAAGGADVEERVIGMAAGRQVAVAQELSMLVDGDGGAVVAAERSEIGHDAAAVRRAGVAERMGGAAGGHALSDDLPEIID